MYLTPLKYLLFIENSTCVFRNYWCLKKCRRILLVCWLFMEILNMAVAVFANLTNKNEDHWRAPRIYFLSVTAFSFYVMIASLYHSKKFYQLLLKFDTFYKLYADKIYYRNIVRAQKGLTITVVLFCCAKIIGFTYIRTVRSKPAEMGLVASTLSTYNIAVCDFRYIFQYFILHCILFVIAEQLNAISRSIDIDINSMRESEKNKEHGHRMATVTVNTECLKKFDKWVKAYKIVNDSCNLWNAMFSTQLTIMLLIMTAYYIILLYSIAIQTVTGMSSPIMICMNVFSMVVFLMALFVISRVGQKVQNNSGVLRQKLCKLIVVSLENEQYYKLTKDLLRCVRARPCYVHAFGSFIVNMSMLPSIVAFFMSYTVIALQFNNVL